MDRSQIESRIFPFALILVAAASCTPPKAVGPDATPPDAMTLPDAMQPPGEPTLDPAKSLIITNRSGFRDVADPASHLTLGRLLAARHEFMNVKRVASGKPSIGAREGTLMAFTKLSEDVDEHNALPEERRIGLVKQTTNPFRTKVLDNWDPTGTGLELPETQKDGPFRLLAVINRLDVAGADDNPGGGSTLPEDKRKFFGEGRLVFGLTATDDSGQPYPMTVIMEYHLPFLHKQLDGSGTRGFVADRKDFNYDSISDADWIEQRKNWATLWMELSRYSFDSTEYRTLLKDIVTLFARPENSVALRVGYVVDPTDPLDTTREFEYRENYTQGGFLLAPRDLARDVHPCVAQQPFFADLLTQRWQASTHDLIFDYKWPSAVANQAEISAACGLPMGAKPGEQGPRVHVSRFLPDKWWPALYGTSPTDYNLNNMEEKRHDFSMTTCSGCHSQETGTRGFMIFPRAENADATVADFLKDRATTVTMPKGAQYTYSELARRKALVLSFLVGKYPGACPDGLCVAPPSTATNLAEEMLIK
jgi:hypothetical protein